MSERASERISKCVGFCYRGAASMFMLLCALGGKCGGFAVLLGEVGRGSGE